MVGLAGGDWMVAGLGNAARRAQRAASKVIVAILPLGKMLFSPKPLPKSLPNALGRDLPMQYAVVKARVESSSRTSQKVSGQVEIRTAASKKNNRPCIMDLA